MRAKILSVLFLVVGLLLLGGATQAQPIITTAPTLTACPGNPVSAPIIVDNFANVASISLALEIDLAALTYTSYTNNPSLAGGFLLVNPAGNQVKAAYFGLAPLALANGTTLFTFNFNYLGGSSPLHWDLSIPGNCSYSDLLGNILPSTWIDGSVSLAAGVLQISNQPASVSIMDGGNATFTVTSNAPNFQWEYSTDGTNWVSVVDGGMYSGAQTNSLTITGATLALNGIQYRCICSESACSQSLTSAPATLTVTPLTSTIIVTAGNVTACPGTAATVPVNVTDADNFSYFSMKLNYNPAVVSYTSYSGANAALTSGNLTITHTAGQVFAEFFSTTPVSAGTGTLFNLNFAYTGGNTALGWSTTPGECEFTNLSSGILPSAFIDGGINTNAAAPQIQSQPANQTIVEQTNASFSVGATNATSFQWQVSTNSGTTWSNLINGTNYSGVSTSSLTVVSTPLSFDGYWYRCIAAETVCNQSVASNHALLSVQPGGGDIVTTLGNFATCPGDSTLVIPVNVTNFNSVSSLALIYSYDPAVISFLSFQNVNSGLGNGVFLSNNINNEIRLAWFSNTPTTLGNTTICEVVFTYLGGTTNLVWDVLTPGSCQYSDTIGNPLPATFVDGTVGLAGGAPVVTQQPVPTATSAGGSASFTVNGQNANSYQWQESANAGTTWSNLSNGGMYAGTSTTTLTITGATVGMDGNWYRCVVTGGQCNVDVNSVPATLTVAAGGTLILTAGYVNTCPGGAVTVPVTVSQFIDVASFSLKLDYDASALSFASYQNGHPALSSGFLLVNDMGGFINLGWFSVTPVTIADASNLVELVFNYNANFSNLTWDLTGGTGIFTNLNGQTIPAIFVNGAIVSEGPLVLANPTDVTAFPGDDKQVEVSAILANSYQWQVNDGSGWADLSNDVTYNGVDTYILEVNDITSGMDGYQYRCALDGICGMSYTEPATLSVIALIPVVANAAVVNSCPGAVTAPVTVSDFNNIGTFTMVLNYPATLIYTNYTNVNPALTGTLNVTNAGTTLTITYAGTSALNLGSGTLLNLNFTAASGNGALTWNSAASSFQTLGGATMLKTLNNGTVTINPLPSAPSNITGPASVCQGTATTIYTSTGSANSNSYVWSITPSFAGTITGTGLNITITWDPTFTGTSYLAVKGVNTCGMGPQFSKVITVVAAPTVTLDPFAATCSGTPAFALSGGTPLNGTYSGPGITANQFDPSVAGAGTHVITYTVTVGGCSNSATQPIVVNPTPVVTLALPVSALCYYAGNYGLTGGSPAGGTYSGSSVNSATGVFTPQFNLAGTTVVITYTFTQNGCENKATGNIFVDFCNNVDNPESLSLNMFPNPNNGVFELNLDAITENVSISIFNSIGQSVYTEEVKAGNTSYTNTLDLSNQPKGIYYLRVNGSQTLLEEKFVIQ